MRSREEHLKNFEREYAKLNSAQKKAVDTTEGPVMVIAGPGTGKTQILASRIANILLNNTVLPSNILCLTFTDAAVGNMKKRLNAMIGPESYDVGIFTYHSFCNKVIVENPHLFNLYGDHALADDLDIIELFLELLNALPSSNPLYSLKENYHDTIKKLKNLFREIKKENWNATEMKKNLENTIELLHLNPDLQYKRKHQEFAKGELNPSRYKKARLDLEKTLAAVDLYIHYQDALSKKNLYDFDDMILWVIEKFSSNPDLLADYQEKYQYILVDEYQDTNGSQMEIVRLLASYWDSPNVFVVGDDDQAIFRFQGANLSNMSEFIKQYQAQLIVLQENYRSSQTILDAASHCISHNHQRLVNYIQDLSKDLTASGKYQSIEHKPVILQNTDPHSEVHLVCRKIKELISSKGISPDAIAVLYRKNAESEAYAKALGSMGIPYQTSRSIDALKEPLTGSIIQILQYIENEENTPLTNDHILSHLLHQPFLGLDTIDLAKLFWRFNQLKEETYADPSQDNKPLSLRLCIAEEDFLRSAQLKFPQTVLDFSRSIEKLIAEKNICTVQVLIEKVLYELKILEYILANEDKQHLLQVLNAIFDFVKKISSKQTNLGLKELLLIFQKLISYNISLEVSYFSGSSQSVFLGTMHSAKGLEFDTVFIVNQTEASWKPLPNKNFILPDKYLWEETHSAEDDRRLFYVGMTRAERQLYISFPDKNISDKTSNPSRFVNELLESGLVELRKETISSEELTDHIGQQLQYHHRNFEQIERALLDRFLEKYEMSATSLQKYLNCPLQFYHETVLRIPGARTAYLGYGNAVHQTLEKYFAENLQRSDLNEERLKFLFGNAMRKYKSHFTDSEYVKYLQEGIVHLSGFLKKKSSDWTGVIRHSIELSFKNRRHLSVPISGKIDRIDFLPSGVRIVDYKTGNPNYLKSKIKAPNEKNPHGGDYWLQMVFYKILLQTESHLYPSLLDGVFYNIAPDQYGEYHSAHLAPSAQDIALVGNLISETYDKIKNGIFTPGCGKEDCVWCRYYQQKKLSLPETDFETEED
ncbi:MAG: ATP-dependent helicase [Saprospiraceae bacterium]|nr:ATP-dependent helicase [Saprospiraceae bacterium]